MKPMLASPAKDINFPVYASPKIDGIRAYVQDDLLLSRSGKKIPNRYTQELFGGGLLNGIDGELCVGEPNHPSLMQRTTSGCMSFEGTPNVTYWVFDMWSRPHLTYEERYACIVKSFLDDPTVRQMHDKKILRIVPQDLIKNMRALSEFEELCLASGYEGVMIRDPNSLYKYGRSTAREGALLKVKRWTDSEAVILGFREFMHNGNELEQDNFGYAKRSSHQAGKVPMGTLGSLVCRDVHSNQLVDIGTGFTAAERQVIWDDQEHYKRSIVKYKHFAEAGVKDAPRFPVFIAFRHPEDME